MKCDKDSLKDVGSSIEMQIEYIQKVEDLKEKGEALN